MPLSTFKTNVRVGADVSETKPFVQRHTTGVRLGDAGIGSMKALADQNGQQRFIQRAAHTRSTFTLANVDRDIDCPAISGTSPTG